MFGFGKKSKKESAKVPSLSPAVSNSIVAAVGARSVPSMPSAAQKAFELATDPNAEARDFIEVIESDESLSARVIKIANSVYFDRGKQSQTIEESVIVIGINELRCLLNATSLTEIFPSSHPARTQLWSNDIATAIIARMLVQRTAPLKEGVAFLGGLMHDIGKLLLLQRASDDYSKIMSLVETKGASFAEAETEIYVFSHCEVGLLIAEKWNFTSELKDIIASHHKNWDELKSSDGKLTLPGIVKAADTISHSLGLGHGKGFNRLKMRYTEELDQVWDALQIPSDERKTILDAAKKSFDLEYDLYAGKAG